MCTSWPVTPSSCPTSASRWPRRARRARPWPPRPAPPTAAPQTELTDWTLWKSRVGGGAAPYCVHLPISIPPCHGESKRRGRTTAKGAWEVMDGLAGETDVTLQPAHVHPPQLTCPPFSKKGGIVLGVKALDDSHSKGRGLALCWLKGGFSVLDFSFQLEKGKYKEV